MNVEVFMDNELQLCHSCFTIPDNDFEDYQAQATFSATYIMWLIRVGKTVLCFVADSDLDSNLSCEILTFC